MAAKKHNTRATSPKTKKGRQTQAAPSETVPSDAPLSAERAAAEPVQAPATPTPELSMRVTPMPAEGEITPLDQTLSDPTEKTPKLSALDAAAKVLGESGQAMSCPELIAAMAAKGYWRSPKGCTPAATLYSALLRELKAKGEKARFIKTERGKFALKSVP
jgi:HB1, ASXL, restriction endonuclease HTH domain